MKVLIIYSYPSPTGFNPAILKEVQSNLSKQHQVKTLDLYAENFDPILRFDSDHKRRDLHKDPEMAPYRDLITWADQLIFIFPIWWSGMPAILKGFIDRVFAADFAYSYKKVGLQGHLQGRSAWIITSHNTPAFAMPFVQDYGKVLKKQILKYCGIAPVKLTELCGVERKTDQQRQGMLKKIGEMTRGI